MLVCPFCGAPETDRFDLEDRRFVVFRCMFSPRIEPGLSDAEVAERFRALGPSGAAYFRGTCDTLHVYVTKGEGARRLGAPAAAGPDHENR